MMIVRVIVIMIIVTIAITIMITIIITIASILLNDFGTLHSPFTIRCYCWLLPETLY
jgi:hypothetical protein